MAHPHISAVTIGYRGASHHFVTVADAVRFLRGDDIRTGWFRKVTANVQVGSDDVSETPPERTEVHRHQRSRTTGADLGGQ